MRWEDERYVRLYTRNTPEWLALSWRARGLFGLLMREVDRAGILKVGRLGLKGAAVAVGAPWVEVEAPLGELLEDGCLRFDAERQCVFMPNFMAAQECAQSDRARKQASRERARAAFDVCDGPQSDSESAASVTSRDELTSLFVTESHDQSHAVTTSHTPSHSVTLNQAVLILDKPSREEPPSSTVGSVPPAKSSRGTRLPPEWEPPQAIIERFRTSERVDATASIERFKNHFIGLNGKNAVKVDWSRTFINWVLEDMNRGRAKSIDAASVAESIETFFEVNGSACEKLGGRGIMNYQLGAVRVMELLNEGRARFEPRRFYDTKWNEIAVPDWVGA